MKMTTPHAKVIPPLMFCAAIETNMVVYISIALNLTVVKMVEKLEMDILKSSIVIH